MIKKIIHIADIHIRTIQLHDLYKEQFTKLLKEIQRHSVEWEKEGIEWHEVRIVIAGDIAHQKINISNEQILLTSWFLTELTQIGKVVIIPGNHDFLENNIQRLDSITPVVELLNNENISYYKDGGVYEDDNVKAWHSVVGSDGKEIVADITPYDSSTETLRLWIDAGMPNRIDSGPLHREDLEKMIYERA